MLDGAKAASESNIEIIIFFGRDKCTAQRESNQIQRPHLRIREIKCLGRVPEMRYKTFFDLTLTRPFLRLDDNGTDSQPLRTISPRR